MKKSKKIFFYIYTIFTILVLISVLTASTYAWFSGGKTVDTTRVTSRTMDEEVELILAGTIGGAENGFGGNGSGSGSGSNEGEMLQVNDASLLLPVSTADLKTFLFNNYTVDDMAKGFDVLSKEEYYYHGRFYSRAKMPAEKKMAIYLDENVAGGGILSSDDPKLLNAARLGLVFNNDYSNAVILRLSDASNAPGDRIFNTVVNGETLDGSKVLSVSGDSVAAVADPSVLIDEYTVFLSGDTPRVPAKPLYTLESNETVSVDVYFYLEGCDPDCTDSVKLDKGALQVALYGLLVD